VAFFLDWFLAIVTVALCDICDLAHSHLRHRNSSSGGHQARAQWNLRHCAHHADCSSKSLVDKTDLQHRQQPPAAYLTSGQTLVLEFDDPNVISHPQYAPFHQLNQVIAHNSPIAEFAEPALLGSWWM
jgi:hypothetical protein